MASSSRRWTPRAGKSGTERAFAELATSLMSGKSPSISLEEVSASQQILFLAAWSSLRGGRAVRPIDLPEHFTIAGRFEGNYA
jgi:hypothetical protein